ncbi:MAG: hypothetical protein DRI57_24085 [Deltaproteobacteria bacterium]|nr:MAG: hypothetical protein DRI57_24085 [Deltaproteobacteria bacterium]
MIGPWQLSERSAAVVDGGGIVMLFDSDDNFVNAIEADASGNYAFKGLAVGDYTVKVTRVSLKSGSTFFCTNR